MWTPTLRNIGAGIRAMPDGPEKTAFRKELESLRDAMAAQRRLAGLIRAPKRAHRAV